MAVTQNQVSVGVTATVIVPAANANFPAGGEGLFGPRRRVTVENVGAAAVFLGSSAVTTTTGLSLAANGTVQLDLYPDEALYGIVATGTVTVDYVATGS